ncbi:MAG: FHA domain-containing protein [Candidatus Aureabacteria bacterium]|nr:FHA domain-containing protein [Candidatus Auribacterota bacterium]
MSRLFLKEGIGQGLYHELESGATTIGRSRGCGIELSGLGVSRAHASITLSRGGDALLEDLGSKNGTTLNGKRVEKTLLNDGDEIGIGQTVFIYRDDRGEKEGRFRAIPDDTTVKSEVRSVLRVENLESVDAAEVEENTELLKKAHRSLGILYRVGRAVSTTLNLNELLHSLMEFIFEVVDPDEAFIMLRDSVTGDLKIRLFRSKIVKGREGAVAVSRTILNKVIKEGVAVLSTDASSDSRFKGAESVMRYHMMSTMCVPLISKGGLQGVLSVANRATSGEFTEDDLKLLSGIAGQAALAIENARLYHDIQIEVRRRNNLQRYLSPNEVEQIMEGNKEINLGGEVKEVTILFSDIRDFTRLSEELPPNEVMGILNEYFTEMTRIVFKHEGTIDKYIGDALIVVFGAALPHPDDPFRAVKTAIEMQSALRELNARWAAHGRKTFQIGIGITTGEVLYGNVGSEQRMELTVIGNAVNLASRLADLAKGGDILLSGFTLGAVEGRVIAEKMPPLQIRGKTEPVEVHRVKL